MNLLNIDPWNLLIGFVFGLIGMGYSMYGKKMQNGGIIILGIILMVYPYFVESSFLMVVLGLIFSFSPVFLKRFF